jgi:hypothetical protein
MVVSAPSRRRRGRKVKVLVMSIFVNWRKTSPSNMKKKRGRWGRSAQSSLPHTTGSNVWLKGTLPRCRWACASALKKIPLQAEVVLVLG